MHSHLVMVAAMAAALAASAAATVSCGTMLGDLPLSGCLACVEATMPAPPFGPPGGGPGAGGPGGAGPPGGQGAARPGRGLRQFPGMGPGPRGAPPGSPPVLPNCTACDGTAGYMLMPARPNAPYIGRCVCADGLGAQDAAFLNVTVGNQTLHLLQFTCAACAAGTVPLTPASGVLPYYNITTSAWQLVLNTTLPARPRGRRGRGPGGAGSPPPWLPGTCVSCPDNSQISGPTCVAL